MKVNLSLFFMDNKKKEKNNSDLEYDNSKLPNDYKFLVQKLKRIRETINLLEKNFLEKEP